MLPKQWKTAKTTLIPKPGKPPDMDNLQPISLTSCVGKVLEHVLLNRWQDYLEREGLYPATVIGFRRHLSTQDAMLQLKYQIIDDGSNAHDNKAILGLGLQSSFDNVKHSAILSQVSVLNMGERSCNYIKCFLTGRIAELRARGLQTQEKELGSIGTPQGWVISPMLFNLVMIGVAEKLAEIEDVGTPSTRTIRRCGKQQQTPSPKNAARGAPSLTALARKKRSDTGTMATHLFLRGS
ncbi:hypothetical protein HPB47_005388 [Ixodes persulcatus]|uniref:Uncharacterized protein n=1 Tax=Ixodes persulcatus TaxID=34615 RepID=A0AC60PD51_IXOPE|nr:hypothetical protein HPB47_005388 [Ixodes persulcatus]